MHYNWFDISGATKPLSGMNFYEKQKVELLQKVGQEVFQIVFRCIHLSVHEAIETTRINIENVPYSKQ